MANWCADHLRDEKAWTLEGLPLGARSDEAAKMFDAGIRQLVSWADCEQFGGLEGTIKRMKAAEPEFVMGRVLSLGVDALIAGRSVRSDPTFNSELDAMVADSKKMNNARMQRHARAVQLFANGETRSACVEWEKILAVHPNDLLAIKFSNDAYFFAGDFHGKRDNVARVIDKWDKNVPCYSYLHGMYAFGLEECEEYVEAERHARRALELQPMDCWATHALTHCYEMVSNFGDGIRFMESTETDWAPGNFMACHNYWHLVLFYIEKGDFETALSLYDSQIVHRTKPGGTLLSLTDASSILARFELEGVDVGRERWEAMADMAEQHLGDQILVFNDALIALVLNHLEKGDNNRNSAKSLTKKHTGNMEQFASTEIGDIARVTRDIGLDLCAAIAAFESEHYERAFDTLYPIRTQLYRISGSGAQRDLFTQLLLHAGFRAGDRERRTKTLAILEERNQLKPNSEVANRLLQKHKETAHSGV